MLKIHKTKIITILIILLLCAVLFICGFSARAQATHIAPIISISTQEQNQMQIMAHTLAETARAIGFAEDSEIIVEAKRIWWREVEDIKILANTVYYEAHDCTDRHQQLVAQVVLNRVNDIRFPNDIKSVVTAPKQYQQFYVNNLPNYGDCSEEMQRCFNNALEAFFGFVDCPSNVIFQSGYSDLGTKNYETIIFESPWFKSTTYFNYG